MSNNIIPILIGFTEISFFGYFFYVATYNFLLSIAGHIKSPDSNQDFSEQRRYLILIPAYKEDLVIEQTIVKALKLNYAKSHYNIVVIADSLKEHTLEKLKSLPITLFSISVQNPTKVKAIQFALDNIKESYDAMVILDADNHIDPEFLSMADGMFNQGHKVVQGRRMIKNPNSDLAYLDGLSEVINTHINRKGCYNLGLSASIAGSGFVVDYALGKSIFKRLNSVGGFDKEFELQANVNNYLTAYSDKLIVYDEKVESNKVFKNQRKRWISSQYVFLSNNFIFGLNSLNKGRFVIFNSIILRNFQLPRLLNLGLFTIILIMSIYFSNYLLINNIFWALLFVLFIFSIVISIPRSFYDKRLLLSLIKLPKIFFIMLLMMFRLKGANKSFIHTPHGSNSN
jgi:cellulose synthase/poly-beta-1,6-N-acetylglucosamine synthase-like glycosyltransferase